MISGRKNFQTLTAQSTGLRSAASSALLGLFVPVAFLQASATAQGFEPEHNAQPCSLAATGDSVNAAIELTVIESGEGACPQHGDVAIIRYRGALADTGEVFDSSYDAVLPYPNLFPEGFPFPVAPGVPIEGFYQGLTQMQPGGRYRLFIPAELGYGENPPPGGPIPPGSDLYFWVELVEFMPREVFEQKVAGALPAQR